MTEMACPQCADEDRGVSRIGHNRALCALCNRHAQRVRRATAAALKAEHERDYDRLRIEHERSLYAEALTEYRATPVSKLERRGWAR